MAQTRVRCWFARLCGLMFAYLWSISIGSYPVVFLIGIVMFGMVYSGGPALVQCRDVPDDVGGLPPVDGLSTLTDMIVATMTERAGPSLVGPGRSRSDESDATAPDFH